LNNNVNLLSYSLFPSLATFNSISYHHELRQTHSGINWKSRVRLYDNEINFHFHFIAISEREFNLLLKRINKFLHCLFYFQYWMYCKMVKNSSNNSINSFFSAVWFPTLNAWMNSVGMEAINSYHVIVLCLWNLLNKVSHCYGIMRRNINHWRAFNALLSVMFQTMSPNFR
jgi:hypothetical protein